MAPSHSLYNATKACTFLTCDARVSSASYQIIHATLIIMKTPYNRCFHASRPSATNPNLGHLKLAVTKFSQKWHTRVLRVELFSLTLSNAPLSQPDMNNDNKTAFQVTWIIFCLHRLLRWYLKFSHLVFSKLIWTSCQFTHQRCICITKTALDIPGHFHKNESICSALREYHFSVFLCYCHPWRIPPALVLLATRCIRVYQYERFSNLT